MPWTSEFIVCKDSSFHWHISRSWGVHKRSPSYLLREAGTRHLISINNLHLQLQPVAFKNKLNRWDPDWAVFCLDPMKRDFMTVVTNMSPALFGEPPQSLTQFGFNSACKLYPAIILITVPPCLTIAPHYDESALRQYFSDCNCDRKMMV